MNARFTTTRYTSGVIVIKLHLDGEPWAIAACPGGCNPTDAEIRAVMLTMQSGLAENKGAR